MSGRVEVQRLDFPANEACWEKSLIFVDFSAHCTAIILTSIFHVRFGRDTISFEQFILDVEDKYVGSLPPVRDTYDGDGHDGHLHDHTLHAHGYDI